MTAVETALHRVHKRGIFADAWGAFMAGYRQHYHAGGSATANAFANRPIASLSIVVSSMSRVPRVLAVSMLAPDTRQ